MLLIMYEISNSKELVRAIMLLEDELTVQENMVKENIRLLYENFRSNVLTVITGIATGFLTKKLLFRKSKNPLKNLLGNLLQYGVANLFVNPARVLQALLFPLQNLFGGKTNKDS